MSVNRAANKSQANDDLVLKRREKVARYRLQGLSIREIALALPKGDDPIVDPDTNRPYSHVTIHEDLTAMKTEWAANAARDANEFISEELAKLVEVEKTAWAQKRLDIVLRVAERRAKLLGLDKPTNVNVNINRKDLEAMSDDELETIASSTRTD